MVKPSSSQLTFSFFGVREGERHNCLVADLSGVFLSTLKETPAIVHATVTAAIAVVHAGRARLPESTSRGCGRRRRDDRSDQRHGYGRRNSQAPDHDAPRHRLHLRRCCPGFLQETRFPEPLQREPDNFVRHRCFHLMFQQSSHLRDRRQPIAMGPDQRGGRIQTVRLIAAPVIDEHLSAQFFPDKLVPAGLW